jgi:hypothetical protein
MSELHNVAISDSTIIRRSPSVVATEEDGELIMMNLEHNRYFSLNAIGAAVWRHIEPPCTFGELVNRLANEYEANRAAIVEDMLLFLRRMVKEEVILLT